MNEDQIAIVVEQEDAGQRLDAWLTESLQDEGLDVSRSQVQGWISEGLVVGPRNRVKASDRIVASESYTVARREEAPISLSPEDIPLDVVFEDDDVVVVNKPRGLVVHPGAGHHSGTLINGLLGRGTKLSSLGGGIRPGVVHRIDKDTSGLLMLAKTDMAYHSLTKQLREHTAERMYKAIVHGDIPHQKGTIDAPIGRDPNNRQRMAVREHGKHAITHFHVTTRYRGFTYLELKLETGRTHQIRVHMAYIGFPLAGDPLYGPRRTLAISGQALHAALLGFEHPRTGERLVFEAPLPDDMERLLSDLERPEEP